MKTLVISIVSIFLAGCASNAQLLDDLKPSTSDSSIVLKQAISYEEKRGIGVLWKEGLERGAYRPELENAAGTFFRGPEGCVTQFMNGKAMGPFDGGIWIPKDKINDRPSIYYYYNYNKAEAAQVGGPVITAIMEFNKGKIELMKPITDRQFLEAIKISNLD
jgi:hypothetical protein